MDLVEHVDQWAEQQAEQLDHEEWQQWVEQQWVEQQWVEQQWVELDLEEEDNGGDNPWSRKHLLLPNLVYKGKG